MLAQNAKAILICVIFTKILIMIDCAPKLGHIFLDPLNLEAAGFDINEFQTLHDESSANINKEHNVSDISTHRAIAPENKDGKTEAPQNETSKIRTKKTLRILELLRPVIKILNNRSDMPVSVNASEVEKIPDTDYTSKSPSNNNASEFEKKPDTDYTLKSPINNNASEIKEKSDTNDTLKSDENSSGYLEAELVSDNIGTEKQTTKRDIEESPNILLKIFRTNNDTVEDNNHLFEGYEFDISICRYVKNRLLCGYNKNKGDIIDSEEVTDIGDGCRIRGDRIECGYDKTQPTVDEALRSIVAEMERNMPEIINQPTNDTKTETAPKETDETNKTVTSSSDTQSFDENTNRPYDKCVEKDDRIVCYYVID